MHIHTCRYFVLKWYYTFIIDHAKKNVILRIYFVHQQIQLICIIFFIYSFIFCIPLFCYFLTIIIIVKQKIYYMYYSIIIISGCVIVKEAVKMNGMNV